MCVLIYVAVIRFMFCFRLMKLIIMDEALIAHKAKLSKRFFYFETEADSPSYFPAYDCFSFGILSLLPPKTEVHILGWAMVMITLWTSPRMSPPSTRCWSLWVEVPSCGRRTSSCLFLVAAVQGDDKLLGCFVGISQRYLQRSNGMIGCDCKHNND